MRQVISDLRFFIGESAKLDPLNEALIYRGIINNPKSAHSGVVVVDGINFTKFEMQQANYAFLIAKYPFTLVLDQKVIMYTSQFAIANKNTTVNLAVYPRLRYKIELRYLYGFIEPGGAVDENGNTASAIELPEGCCEEEYDAYLKNLIVDPGECDFFPEMAEFVDDPRCCNKCTYDKILEDMIYTCGDNCSNC